MNLRCFDNYYHHIKYPLETIELSKYVTNGWINLFKRRGFSCHFVTRYKINYKTLLNVCKLYIIGGFSERFEIYNFGDFSSVYSEFDSYKNIHGRTILNCVQFFSSWNYCGLLNTW